MKSVTAEENDDYVMGNVVVVMTSVGQLHIIRTNIKVFKVPSSFKFFGHLV